jgi:hypothetical protein
MTCSTNGARMVTKSEGSKSTPEGASGLSTQPSSVDQGHSTSALYIPSRGSSGKSWSHHHSYLSTQCFDLAPRVNHIRLRSSWLFADCTCSLPIKTDPSLNLPASSASFVYRPSTSILTDLLDPLFFFAGLRADSYPSILRQTRGRS